MPTTALFSVDPTVQALAAHCATPWPKFLLPAEQEAWTHAVHQLLRRSTDVINDADKELLANAVSTMPTPAWWAAVRGADFNRPCARVMVLAMRQACQANGTLEKLLGQMCADGVDEMSGPLIVCMLHDVVPWRTSPTSFVVPKNPVVWGCLMDALAQKPMVRRDIRQVLWKTLLTAYAEQSPDHTDVVSTMLIQQWNRAATLMRQGMWSQAATRAPAWAFAHVERMTPEDRTTALLEQVSLCTSPRTDPTTLTQAMALCTKLVQSAPPESASFVLSTWGRHCPDTPDGLALTRALWLRQQEHTTLNMRTQNTTKVVVRLAQNSKGLVLNAMLGDHWDLTPKQRARILKQCATPPDAWNMPPASFHIIAQHTPPEQHAALVSAVALACAPLTHIPTNAAECLAPVWSELPWTAMHTLAHNHPNLLSAPVLRAAFERAEMTQHTPNTHITPSKKM